MGLGWVLGQILGRLRGGKLGAKIDQVGPKRPVCPKKCFVGEIFWVVKTTGQLKKQKGVHDTHLPPEVGALGGG